MPVVLCWYCNITSIFACNWARDLCIIVFVACLWMQFSFAKALAGFPLHKKVNPWTVAPGPVLLQGTRPCLHPQWVMGWRMLTTEEKGLYLQSFDCVSLWLVLRLKDYYFKLRENWLIQWLELHIPFTLGECSRHALSLSLPSLSLSLSLSPSLSMRHYPGIQYPFVHRQTLSLQVCLNSSSFVWHDFLFKKPRSDDPGENCRAIEGGLLPRGFLLLHLAASES